ncbi:MAG: NADH-quinone oxidoreductase subunit C [Chitinophagaceae bacterium]|nr:NADH-quinone oxidoreductase subunit C [Chitinophagaceae bacterium]
MQIEELKIKITALFPTVVFAEGTQWLTLNIEPTEWLPLAKQLRNEDALYFDFLSCLTCVDWKTHLTMVYHLDSTKYRHTIVVKVKLDAAKPEIETVSTIWKTAESHEREVYEMFGVNFLNHPDLRLMILPDGWEGKNPLRKDFEDPINMIRL